MWLTGIGIIVAISSGFLGLLEGGFLYAIHGEILGEHMTTSLIFDGGIYLAVLGMLTMAINALGGYLRPVSTARASCRTRLARTRPTRTTPPPSTRPTHRGP